MRKAVVALVVVGALIGAIFAVRYGVDHRGNGWDDVVQASDELQKSPKWREYLQAAANADQPAFEVERQAVEENAGVLALIHRGVGKKVDMPFDPSPTKAGQSVARFGRLRDLAKLIAVTEDVQLERGDRDAAIDTFGDGIRLGRAMYRHTFIGGLVGVAVESIAIKPIAVHVGELSGSQCSHLERSVAELLKLRPDIHSILEGEYAELQLSVDAAATNPKQLGLEWLIDEKDKARFRQEVAKDPLLVQDIRAQVLPLVKRQFATLEREWPLAVSKRTPLDLKSSDKLGWSGKIAHFLLPVARMALDSLLKGDARLKLLAVEAGVTSYKLSHHSLPPDLASLSLGDLATDPFTGKPFVYRMSSDRCFVYSVGPNGKDDGGYGLPTGHGDDIGLPEA